jgi:hypothetical protein
MPRLQAQKVEPLWAFGRLSTHQRCNIAKLQSIPLSHCFLFSLYLTSIRSFKFLAHGMGRRGQVFLCHQRPQRR